MNMKEPRKNSCKNFSKGMKYISKNELFGYKSERFLKTK